jgi:hypothetical protein
MTQPTGSTASSAGFPSTAPAGFLWRVAFPDRWLRIHSLPESKRYSETESERAEILRRHNAVASYMLGEGSDCILFLARFGQDKLWPAEPDIPLNAGRPEYVQTYENDGDEWQFFSTPVVWRSEQFNDLILASADDATGPIFFANKILGAAYAPYDGGADLFFPNPSNVEEAKRKFGSWLSARVDGR